MLPSCDCLCQVTAPDGVTLHIPLPQNILKGDKPGPQQPLCSLATFSHAGPYLPYLPARMVMVKSLEGKWGIKHAHCSAGFLRMSIVFRGALSRANDPEVVRADAATVVLRPLQCFAKYLPYLHCTLWSILGFSGRALRVASSRGKTSSRPRFAQAPKGRFSCGQHGARMRQARDLSQPHAFPARA